MYILYIYIEVYAYIADKGRMFCLTQWSASVLEWEELGHRFEDYVYRGALWIVSCITIVPRVLNYVCSSRSLADGELFCIAECCVVSPANSCC